MVSNCSGRGFGYGAEEGCDAGATNWQDAGTGDGGRKQLDPPHRQTCGLLAGRAGRFPRNHDRRRVGSRSVPDRVQRRLQHADCLYQPQCNPEPQREPSASTSAAPTGVLTGSELVWLQAIDREQAKITNALAKEPATPSAAQMLAVASALRGCTTTVTRIGRRSDPRLLPVFESMMKACAQFAKAAKCQTTLAVSNDPAQLNEAASCISATTLAGGKEMATAEEAIIRLEHPGG